MQSIHEKGSRKLEYGSRHADGGLGVAEDGTHIAGRRYWLGAIRDGVLSQGVFVEWTLWYNDLAYIKLGLDL